MPKRSIIIFLSITSVLILLMGLYRVYEIYYPSYFSQTEYSQMAFIGQEERPTKIELLFSGFKNLKIITISSIIGVLLISAGKDQKCNTSDDLIKKQ